MKRPVILRHLAFTGTGKEQAKLNFSDQLNLIWGASNTGKSYTLKALNFMFGGSTPLPDINESQGYDTAWLGLTLEDMGDVTLSRALRGGAFLLHDGLVTSPKVGEGGRKLQPKHDASSEDNLSSLLLGTLGLREKKVADNAYGRTRSLSFRDLDLTFLVDETSIQIERSPIEGGQRDDRTAERSVFRLLLTGGDDSAVIAVDDPKKFNAARQVRVEVVSDMIADIDRTLAAEYSDSEDLSAQLDRLENSLAAANDEFTRMQTSMRRLLVEKRELSRLIPNSGGRLDDVNIHIDRFVQLQEIYLSDISRLEGLEEASFVLGLTAERYCPLCGAPPSAQTHAREHDEIRAVREGSR